MPAPHSHRQWGRRIKRTIDLVHHTTSPLRHDDPALYSERRSVRRRFCAFSWSMLSIPSTDLFRPPATCPICSAPASELSWHSCAGFSYLLPKDLPIWSLPQHGPCCASVDLSLCTARLKSLLTPSNDRDKCWRRSGS